MTTKKHSIVLSSTLISNENERQLTKGISIDIKIRLFWIMNRIPDQLLLCSVPPPPPITFHLPEFNRQISYTTKINKKTKKNTTKQAT